MKPEKSRRKGSHPSWPAPLVALALALLPLNAQALANCLVFTAGLTFPNYDYTSAAPLDGVGTVEIRCSLIGIISLFVNYDIQLSEGASGNYATRTMLSGAHLLRYNLYTNAGRTTVWRGDQSPNSFVTGGYLLGLFTTVTNHSVYGQIPAGQNVPAGLYKDNITLTVNY